MTNNIPTMMTTIKRSRQSPSLGKKTILISSLLCVCIFHSASSFIVNNNNKLPIITTRRTTTTQTINFGKNHALQQQQQQQQQNRRHGRSDVNFMTVGQKNSVSSHIKNIIANEWKKTVWGIAITATALSLTFTTPPPATAISPPPQTTTITTTPGGYSLIDEVWTLIDKYYIDRTYNNQNWNDVRLYYTTQDDISPSDDRTTQLTTQMVQSLGDKYSRLLDAPSYNRIQKYDLIGIGATLMPDGDKRIMIGAPPLPNSASAKAGLKQGDYITKVNGVPTEGKTSFDIIDQIDDDPNAATVTVTVLTQSPDDLKGEGYVRDVTLAREFVTVSNPVTARITERRGDGTVVGYVRVKEFNALVQSSLRKALGELREGGANAYVLDLRGNPGGAFQSAVEIAGLFLEDGRLATIVWDNNDVQMPFKTRMDNKGAMEGGTLRVTGDPLVVWVDGSSASASEVLAGALHDNCRAVVMGKKSFGKGLIQAVYGLKNGMGLVLTVAKYTTPNGTEIQGQGITPDVEGGVPAVAFLPGISSDTTQVDFRGIIQDKLKMCAADAKQ